MKSKVPSIVLWDRCEIVFSQIAAAWQEVSEEHQTTATLRGMPETGICLKTNHQHQQRGAVMFFPQPHAAMLVEAIGEENLLAKAPGKLSPSLGV